MSPWDKERVLESVKKTGKALIVYEDNITGGFGAEVAATIAQDAFDYLDAPIKRVTGKDVPMSYAPTLVDAYLPNVADTIQAIKSAMYVA